MAMTIKQKLFAEEYLNNGYNALKAYHDVFKNNNPKPSYPYELLKKPEIQAYIDQRRNEIYDSLLIDSKRIYSELAEIAFAEKGDEIYTTSNKLKALEQLGKMMGLQITKIETADVIDVKLVSGED